MPCFGSHRRTSARATADGPPPSRGSDVPPSSSGGLNRSGTFKRQHSPDAANEDTRRYKRTGHDALPHEDNDGEQHFIHYPPPPGTGSSSDASSSMSSHGSRRLSSASGMYGHAQYSHYAPYYDHATAIPPRPPMPYYDHRPGTAEYYPPPPAPPRTADSRSRYQMHQHPSPHHSAHTPNRPTTAPTASPIASIRHGQPPRSRQQHLSPSGHPQQVGHPQHYSMDYNDMPPPRQISSSSGHPPHRSYADYQAPHAVLPPRYAHEQHDPQMMQSRPPYPPPLAAAYQSTPARYDRPSSSSSGPPTSSQGDGNGSSHTSVPRLKLPSLSAIVSPTSGTTPPHSATAYDATSHAQSPPPSVSQFPAPEHGQLPPPVMPKGSTSSLHSLLNPPDTQDPDHRANHSHAPRHPRSGYEESVRTRVGSPPEHRRRSSNEDEVNEEDHRYYQNRARAPAGYGLYHQTSEERRRSNDSRTSDGMGAIPEE